MDLLETKIIACITLGVGTLIVGLLPTCFASRGRQQYPLLLSCLLCFGGGVLLSTSIIHMLMEVRESLKSYREYAEIIFCAGFFILYIIDEIVHICSNDDAGHSAETPVCNSERRHSFHAGVHQYYGADNETSLLCKSTHSHNTHVQPAYNPYFYKTCSDSQLFLEGKPPSQLCHVGHQEPCESTLPAINIGLLIALTIHSLLEGLSVGLEEVSSKVLLMLGAIASHKLVVGFCLGVELTANTNYTLCRQFINISLFALGSVGGIALGILVTNATQDLSQLGIAVMQGLAGGTLLYVTVSEILPRERARWHQQHTNKSAGVFQCIAVLTGFIMMTLLSKYLDG